MKNKVIWFTLGCVMFGVVDFIAYCCDSYCRIKQENKTQKQTIERLNIQLSKMDTLHDECFKISEIQKKK